MDRARSGRGARLMYVPRRARGVLGRLLRMPAHTNERFDQLSDKLDALRSDAALQQEVTAQREEAAARALSAQVAQLRAELEAVRHTLAASLDSLSVTSAAAVEQLALGPLPLTDGAGAPLVSIVLPVRDRPGPLVRAVRSVRSQAHERWELLVVDDGSTDDPASALGALLDDPRIRLLRAQGRGAAAARNLAIAEAGGELVTFLDSDNWWYPERLARVVAAMADGAAWAIDRQLVLGAGGGTAFVRADDRPLVDLRDGNFVDVGSVTVRTEVLRDLPAADGTGPFDEGLPRLSDWDLVLRLAAQAPPVRVASVAQVYDERADDRITRQVPYGPADHRIRTRRLGQPGAGLRVLCAEWHFPQVSETYIQSDVVGLRALGVEVEAWSEEGVSAPYDPGIPVHRGELADAIERVRPDLVLSHWLHVGLDQRATTRRHGIPHAVRGHGFDQDAAVIDELCRDPGVVVHLFPHLAGGREGHPNVSIDPVGFDPDRFRPAADKDRRMVLRIAAGLFTKDLEVFLLAAKRCPDLRFVLALSHTYQVEHRTEELVERVAALGAPVEVLIDVPHREAAELTAEAGLYMHTHGDSHPVGMPISIAESMATGSYVLARDLPGMGDYVRGGGSLYRGDTPDARADHAAALLNATLAWDEQRWQAARSAALDVAWARHPADLVAARLLEVWRVRLGVRAAAG